MYALTSHYKRGYHDCVDFLAVWGRKPTPKQVKKVLCDKNITQFYAAYEEIPMAPYQVLCSKNEVKIGTAVTYRLKSFAKGKRIRLDTSK